MHPQIKEDIMFIVSQNKEMFSSLEGKRLLITGARGMIGSYFLHTIYYLNNSFFKEKCKVYCPIHKPVKKEDSIFYLKKDPNFSFFKKDLSKFKGNLPEADYIIHAASNAAPKTYLESPLETINLNVFLTQKLLESIKNTDKKLLYISSGEVYGSPPDEFIPTKEDYEGITNHLGVRSCYVESKKFAETLCINYFRKHDVDVRIARPIHVFGPGFKKDDSRVWAYFINSAIKGENLSVVRGVSRGFCYIADGILQLWLILLKGKKGEIYNVGNSSESTIESLAEKICFYMNNKIKYEVKDEKIKDSPDRSCPDMTKIFSSFNIKNYYNLDDTIQNTLKWVRENE